MTLITNLSIRLMFAFSRSWRRRRRRWCFDSQRRCGFWRFGAANT